MKHQSKRRRGEGSIYIKPRSPFLWIKYYKAGKPIRESLELETPRRRPGYCVNAWPEIEPNTAEGVRIEQLAGDLFRDYRINEHRSLTDVQARWRLHLKPFFGSVIATQSDSRQLECYVDSRRAEHASNATINRELACLKRMYRLAYQARPPRVPSVPHFPHLKENNVRQGFITACAVCGTRRPLLGPCGSGRCWKRGYNYGWRVSELLSLRVGSVGSS